MRNKIGRFLLKDYLSFDKVDINFESQKKENNLILFTGASGAGKSILLNALVSAFGGIKDIKAKYNEVEILNNKLNFDSFELEGQDEDFVMKYVKNEKVKFYLDDKTISKKKLNEFSNNFIKHLHLKDTSEFESKNFIKTLDDITQAEDSKFSSFIKDYQETYKKYKDTIIKIKEIEEEEKNLEDLKEFTQFEIEKIEKISPRIGEYEELQEIKKRLSNKDKIEEKLEKAQGAMYSIGAIENFLTELGEDTTIYDEFVNQINNAMEKFNDSLSDLEELDIESTLDRISDVKSLATKYGSIEECLKELEEKKLKLKEYDNISFTKQDLLKEEKELFKSLGEKSKKLTEKRKKTASKLHEKINYYLQFLYLDNAKILFKDMEFNATGKDEIYFELNGVNLETISSGEFNRLRLALLTAKTDFSLNGGGGILFLDEIDANLSGKESESISKVVTKLSQTYQVFAISHQPQLTAKANMHFLVEKEKGKSSVRLLNINERETEISRMISGENITEEAKTFAKNLLSNN